MIQACFLGVRLTYSHLSFYIRVAYLGPSYPFFTACGSGWLASHGVVQHSLFGSPVNVLLVF
jgi:hypothetical protein